MQADVSRLEATKAWLQQGLAKAKKPAKQPGVQQQDVPLSSPPHSAGGSAAASSSSLPPSGSVSKEQIKQKLKDLKELFDDELLTEEEFTKHKDLLMIDFRAAQ